MANFQHPILCLRHVNRQLLGLSDLLVASAGSHLYTYSVVNGQRLDSWPKIVDSSEPDATTASTSQGQAPPEKRRKLSSASPDQNEEKPESNESASQTWSSIPLVVVSADGKYVVALTAEDKSIRVFEIGTDGQLNELSTRIMPKRSSALTLTPDGQNILSGDKFGDVYSMPLIPGEYVKAQRPQQKPSNPAATSLTVHTKRNLESLEQQLRQVKQGTKQLEETGILNFEHQLILGHVSMLMDLVSASLPTETGSRSYVLTADRDEHIRVSRGIPQSHVIEQHCLGHTSVISKLCIPSWAPGTLVSGDGDGNLFVWDWSKGQAYQKISLGETLQTEDVTVRGIWAVALEHVKLVLVSLDGSAQLLCFTFEHDGTVKFQNTVQLSGNVLEVAYVASQESIAVSVDGVRESGSTNTWKTTPGAPQTLLESFHVKASQEGVEFLRSEDSLALSINSAGTSDLPASLDAKQKKELDDSLYSLGNLKKKTFDD